MLRDKWDEKRASIRMRNVAGCVTKGGRSPTGVANLATGSAPQGRSRRSRGGQLTDQLAASPAAHEKFTGLIARQNRLILAASAPQQRYFTAHQNPLPKLTGIKL